MKEIDWKQVAIDYELTPAELEEQVFITSCVLSDMILDRSPETATATQFTCEQPKYKLELTVRRIYNI